MLHPKKILLLLWLGGASFAAVAQVSTGLWPYPTHPVPTDARGLPLDSTAGYFPAGPFLDSARYTVNTVEVDSGGVSLQRELTWPQFQVLEPRWREAGIRYRIVGAKPAFRVTHTQTPAATTPFLFYELGLPILFNAYSGRETYRAFVQRAFSGGYLVVTVQRKGKRCTVETQVFKKNGYPMKGITYQQTERRRSRLARTDFEKLRAVWQERKLTRLAPYSWHDSEVVVSDDGAQWLLETHLPEGYHFIGCSHSDLRNAAGAVKAAGREMLLVGGAGNVRL